MQANTMQVRTEKPQFLYSVHIIKSMMYSMYLCLCSVVGFNRFAPVL